MPSCLELHMTARYLTQTRKRHIPLLLRTSGCLSSNMGAASRSLVMAFLRGGRQGRSGLSRSFILGSTILHSPIFMHLVASTQAGVQGCESHFIRVSRVLSSVLPCGISLTTRFESQLFDSRPVRSYLADFYTVQQQSSWTNLPAPIFNLY